MATAFDGPTVQAHCFSGRVAQREDDATARPLVFCLLRFVADAEEVVVLQSATIAISFGGGMLFHCLQAGCVDGFCVKGFRLWFLGHLCRYTDRLADQVFGFRIASRLVVPSMRMIKSMTSTLFTSHDPAKQ